MPKYRGEKCKTGSKKKTALEKVANKFSKQCLLSCRALNISIRQRIKQAALGSSPIINSRQANTAGIRKGARGRAGKESLSFTTWTLHDSWMEFKISMRLKYTQWIYGSCLIKHFGAKWLVLRCFPIASSGRCKLCRKFRNGTRAVPDKLAGRSTCALVTYLRATHHLTKTFFRSLI